MLGVLPTMFMERIREQSASLTDLEQAFPGKVLTPIHRAATLSECPGMAQTIFEKDPTSRAAEEYGMFVKEVLRY